MKAFGQIFYNALFIIWSSYYFFNNETVSALLILIFAAILWVGNKISAARETPNNSPKEAHEADFIYQQSILAELIKISDALANQPVKTNYNLEARRKISAAKKSQIEAL